MSGSTGRFSSPAYLPTNDTTLNCLYTINKQKDGYSVGLSFESVDLKNGTLTVSNGDIISHNYTGKKGKISEQKMGVTITGKQM